MKWRLFFFLLIDSLRRTVFLESHCILYMRNFAMKFKEVIFLDFYYSQNLSLAQFGVFM